MASVPIICLTIVKLFTASANVYIKRILYNENIKKITKIYNILVILYGHSGVTRKHTCPVPKTGGVPLPLQSDILEQYKRIELSLIAWEAIVLPLN